MLEGPCGRGTSQGLAMTLPRCPAPLPRCPAGARALGEGHSTAPPRRGLGGMGDVYTPLSAGAQRVKPAQETGGPWGTVPSTVTRGVWVCQKGHVSQLTHTTLCALVGGMPLPWFVVAGVSCQVRWHAVPSYYGVYAYCQCARQSVSGSALWQAVGRLSPGRAPAVDPSHTTTPRSGWVPVRYAA